MTANINYNRYLCWKIVSDYGNGMAEVETKTKVKVRENKWVLNRIKCNGNNETIK